MHTFLPWLSVLAWVQSTPSERRVLIVLSTLNLLWLSGPEVAVFQMALSCICFLFFFFFPPVLKLPVGVSGIVQGWSQVFKILYAKRWHGNGDGMVYGIYCLGIEGKTSPAF